MTNQVYILLDTEYGEDDEYGHPVVDRVFATEALANEYAALYAGTPWEEGTTPATVVPVLTALPPHLRKLTVWQYVPTTPKAYRPDPEERWEIIWLDRAQDDGAVKVIVEENGKSGVKLIVSGADEVAVRSAFAENLPVIKERAKAIHDKSVDAARKAAETKKKREEEYQRGLAIAAAHGFHERTPEQVLAEYTDEELTATLASLQEMEKTHGGYALHTVCKMMFGGPEGAQYPTTTIGIRDIVQEQRRRVAMQEAAISRDGLT